MATGRRGAAWPSYGPDTKSPAETTLAVECPFCGALPKEYCQSTSGIWTQWPHGARLATGLGMPVDSWMLRRRVFRR